eukprot:CAMPEP_0177486826 /NCGR_PEP_ID=MMETSP0369-20130122/29299_1 /TAXON_ID=447022 ORGANISM="Scrippsiella hangoei-like, Strain SHHI-4" /NCGR_SAMPLE_ID=MMETSP0369 /ASSEMBLY_ACC=CAM_ASM_000364 /LENGTH=343 /DNA_ID=CAMNT_0018963093 /DNA_START=148 /DNA_END=1176 /DNA_ORIENTATION=-
MESVNWLNIQATLAAAAGAAPASTAAVAAKAAAAAAARAAASSDASGTAAAAAAAAAAASTGDPHEGSTSSDTGAPKLFKKGMRCTVRTHARKRIGCDRSGCEAEPEHARLWPAQDMFLVATLTNIVAGGMQDSEAALRTPPNSWPKAGHVPVAEVALHHPSSVGQHRGKNGIDFLCWQVKACGEHVLECATAALLHGGPLQLRAAHARRCLGLRGTCACSPGAVLAEHLDVAEPGLRVEALELAYSVLLRCRVRRQRDREQRAAGVELHAAGLAALRAAEGAAMREAGGQGHVQATHAIRPVRQECLQGRSGTPHAIPHPDMCSPPWVDAAEKMTHNEEFEP